MAGFYQVNAEVRQANAEVRQANASDEAQFNIPNTEIFPTETVCLDQSPSRRRNFHEFSRFPPEIQLRILELIPEPKRVVTIHLVNDPRAEEDSPNPSSQNPLYTESNELGNVISGVRYRAILPHPLRGSILLQICRTSRELALRRYRIRLPMNPGNPHDSEYLYIDPESDTLHLDFHNALAETLVGFLHDLRAYDKEGSGIYNLAVNNYFSRSVMRQLNLRNLRPAEVRSFKQSLMTLQHLWFFHLFEKDNRYMGQRPAQPSNDLRSFSVHAAPLFPEASEYHLMPADPRLLQPSDFLLPRFTNTPMAECLAWECMETSFGLTEENGSLPQREISDMIAIDATGDHIGWAQEDRSQRREHAIRIISSLKKHIARMGFQAQSQVSSLEESETGQQVSVGGFWIFPRDLLDGEEPQMDGVNSFPMNFVDLSSRSPALGVFYLQKGSNRITT